MRERERERKRKRERLRDQEVIKGWEYRILFN